jgi:hypothetical protein
MLPIPNIAPSTLMQRCKDLFRVEDLVLRYPQLRQHPRYGEMLTIQRVFEIQQEEYRKCEPERYADDYAARVLRRYADDLGLSSFIL